MGDDDILPVGVVGASGRMGRALMECIAEDPFLELACAIVRPGSLSEGKSLADFLPHCDFGCMEFESSLVNCAQAAVIVDFSTPEVALKYGELAASEGIPYVTGTTGFSSQQLTQISQIAQKTAVVQANNMSLGVNILAMLTTQASKALGEDFDVEILEMHHNKKLDAPSGTALMLGDAVVKGRSAFNLPKGKMQYERVGHRKARDKGEIGFAVLRGGDVVGEHDVVFAGLGERIVLRHIATDRMIFARGALRAAQWVFDKPVGEYTMQDVLCGLT
jgi:4-hydroxy-tetrahydrodipicolinate reductase